MHENFGGSNCPAFPLWLWDCKGMTVPGRYSTTNDTPVRSGDEGIMNTFRGGT